MFVLEEPDGGLESQIDNVQASEESVNMTNAINLVNLMPDTTEASAHMCALLCGRALPAPWDILVMIIESKSLCT